MPILAFCELTTASGSSSWHLRWLDNAGLKLRGGITTSPLCMPLRKPSGWDLDVEITEWHLTHSTCLHCLNNLGAETRQNRAAKAVAEIQKASKDARLDKLTEEEIAAEIRGRGDSESS